MDNNNTINNNIIFQDKYIIAVNKPFGMLSQMDKLNNSYNVCNLVTKYLKKDVHIINRLDRGVGGIVLFAKDSKIAKILSEDLINNNINKKYLTLTYNLDDIVKEEDTLINYLMKNQRLNMSKIVNKNSSGSKEAILKYKKISNLDLNNIKLALLEVDLITGRHHQIRIQLANAGFSIVGDPKYMNKNLDKNMHKNIYKKLEFKNICLFSNKLEFKHPITKEYINLEIFDTNTVTSINYNTNYNYISTIFN